MKNWLWTLLFLSLGAQASMTQLLEQKFKELFTPGVEGGDWFSQMAYDGHNLRLVKEGTQVMEERLKLILSAKRSILFSTFIYDVDETSDKISRAMCYMARKGVDVRMMVDSHGAGKFYKQYADRLRGCKVGILQFNPAAWGLEKIVKSMHEKLLIIDGEKVYMGGRGVQNSYHHVKPAHKFFHDMDIIIEGPVACWWHLKYLQTYHRTRQSTDQCYDFSGCRPRSREYDEMLYGKQSYPSCRPVVHGTSRALPVYGNPIFDSEKTPIEDVYIKALENLETGAQVKLYAPYFVPTKRFGAALIKAKKEKQAQISVLTNSIESNDEGVAVLVAMSHEVGYLMKEGIDIRLFPGPQTLHRKVGIFGGKYAHVGSDNLDNRGQHYQSESVVLTDDQAIIKEIETEFDNDYDQTLPLTQDYIKKINKKSGGLSGWFSKEFREFF